MPYLVYVPDPPEIVVMDDKPASYVGFRHVSLCQNLIQLWHDPSIRQDALVQAIRVLVARLSGFPFAEVNEAVNQIVARYPSDECSIVALGASPKFIKWVLKAKGYNTVAIVVSKVTKAEPNSAFAAYVAHKLEKIRHQKIVIIDFVDSGESIVQIKRYFGKVSGKQVFAVALGTGKHFRVGSETVSPQEAVAYAQEIDYIVRGIPELTKGFEANTYKQKLGRSKDMRDFATFPQTVKGGQVMRLQKEQYAAMKPAFARAAALGKTDIRLEDFTEIEESQQSDADDDADSNGGSFSW